MRTIEELTSFRRDYKREKKGPHRKGLNGLIVGAVSLLVEDKPLAEARRDHALSGEWNDCRECHLKPDLLMIYRKPTSDRLELVRLGSHSELFG